MTKKKEAKVRKFIMKRFGGYGKRWEVGSEEKEPMFLIYETELDEVIEILK